MKVSQAVWGWKRILYRQSYRHICVDAGYGGVIVAGEHTCELEFDFVTGEIRNLICSCSCGNICKHEVSTIMQLRETLELIDKHYAALNRGYFVAIAKGDLFQFAVDGRETSSCTL